MILTKWKRKRIKAQKRKLFWGQKESYRSEND
jgi:hypothetical protein